jgi:hypothetical protein
VDKVEGVAWLRTKNRRQKRKKHKCRKAKEWERREGKGDGVRKF